MPQGTAYPFGLRDIKITPITNAVTETLGTPLDMPAARTMSFTEAEDYEELRGDDKTITARGLGASVDWDLESGGISLPIYRAIAGGTLTETGVTPAQITKIRKLATDARPFFKAEGQALSDSGGDVHVVLFRCRATGDIEGEFSDGSFYLTQCSGQAFPSQNATSIDALYDIIQNETVTAIPAV
jgi:hypothetical protein